VEACKTVFKDFDSALLPRYYAPLPVPGLPVGRMSPLGTQPNTSILLRSFNLASSLLSVLCERASNRTTSSQHLRLNLR
jgi:hypothetical protein